MLISAGTNGWPASLWFRCDPVDHLLIVFLHIWTWCLWIKRHHLPQSFAHSWCSSSHRSRCVDISVVSGDITVLLVSCVMKISNVSKPAACHPFSLECSCMDRVLWVHSLWASLFVPVLCSCWRTSERLLHADSRSFCSELEHLFWNLFQCLFQNMDLTVLSRTAPAAAEHFILEPESVGNQNFPSFCGRPLCRIVSRTQTESLTRCGTTSAERLFAFVPPERLSWNVYMFTFSW